MSKNDPHGRWDPRFPSRIISIAWLNLYWLTWYVTRSDVYRMKRKCDSSEEPTLFHCSVIHHWCSHAQRTGVTRTKPLLQWPLAPLDTVAGHTCWRWSEISAFLCSVLSHVVTSSVYFLFTCRTFISYTVHSPCLGDGNSEPFWRKRDLWHFSAAGEHGNVPNVLKTALKTDFKTNERNGLV